MTEQQPDEARAERLEDDLLDAVGTIRADWHDLLTPTTRPTTGSASTDTLTSTERRILLRQQVDQALARWCRVIIRDRRLTATGRSLLDGDTLGMLDLVERHARWLAAEHPDATKAARQLSRLASAVHNTVEPPVREFVRLGPCPFVLPDPEGRLDDGGRSLLWPCQGDILTRIGGDGSAYCTGCGQEAVREWWEVVLGLTLPLVSLPGLVPILHARLGLRVTERTLRRWRRDGVIDPVLTAELHTPAPRPPLVAGIGPVLAWDLFDPLEVIEDIAGMGQTCALCGRPWDGGGDICRACWVATVQSTPKLVDEPTGPAIVGIPITTRRTVAGPWHQGCRHPSCRAIRAGLPVQRPEQTVLADPHDTDRPARCHHSWLPVEQCACGRHAAP
jgi:hypothetical protein